jgi:hypothetical protein
MSAVHASRTCSALAPGAPRSAQPAIRSNAGERSSAWKVSMDQEASRSGIWSGTSFEWSQSALPMCPSWGASARTVSTQSCASSGSWPSSMRQVRRLNDDGARSTRLSRVASIMRSSAAFSGNRSMSSTLCVSGSRTLTRLPVVPPGVTTAQRIPMPCIGWG